VYFPYQPYTQQLQYMEGVINTLNKRGNALLESPTGTGKTLSLLASTLSWLQRHRETEAKLSKEKRQLPVRIIYTSRTHSQLKQVAAEIRSLPYKPIVSVVGSRDQTCANSDLQQFKGRAKNIKCKELVGKNQCSYYDKNNKTPVVNLRNKIASNREVLDLEDLFVKGDNCGTCPFYTMKALADTADIILMPYNYITDKYIRDAYESKLANAIIICDEAHNIERAAEEGASVSLSVNDINLTIHELTDMKKKALGLAGISTNTHEISNKHRVVATKAIRLQKLLGVLEDRLINRGRDFANDHTRKHKDEVVPFQESVRLFFGGGQIDGLQPLPAAMTAFPSAFDAANRLKVPVDERIEDFHAGTFRTFLNLISDIDLILENQPETYELPSSGLSLHKLHKFFLAFMLSYEDLLKSALQEHVDWTQVHSNHFSCNFSLEQSSDPSSFQVSYWCLNPGVTFNAISMLKPISIILTSGTLSPLESYEAELKLPFETKISCSHVIDPQKQVFARIVERGLNNIKMDFSYLGRNNEDMLQDLANGLINVLNQSPGGALVFFPSYLLLESCINYWTRIDFEPGTSLAQEDRVQEGCLHREERQTTDGTQSKTISHEL
jgi:regulator of telomere elongation helicase 1